MSFHKHTFHQDFHQPRFRIDKIEWQKRPPAHFTDVKPTSYFDVLNKITEMDYTHIIGKGSASSILPLNKHWQEVSGFGQGKVLQYIYAHSKDQTFKAQFNINFIKEIKKEVGFSGSWNAFVDQKKYTYSSEKMNLKKAKFYLNDERKNTSGLLIISGQSFYVISPRVDW